MPALRPASRCPGEEAELCATDWLQASHLRRKRQHDREPPHMAYTDDTPKPRRVYRPMSAEAWEARVSYLRQSLAKLRELLLPEPDAALLTVGPHGPFTALWVAPAPNGGPLSIHFTVQNPDRSARWSPPEVFLMLDLLLAFGGGVSVNDNGRGWAYVRPWGGNDRHTLGRLVTNAKAGQVVKQSPRADHHEQHPQHFRVTSGEARPDRPQGAPHRDREAAIATALSYWDRNHRWAAMKVSRAEYEAILRDSFRLVDAYYSQDLGAEHAA